MSSDGKTHDVADDSFSGYKFRVVLLGEAGVGKTSLLRRFTENTFDEHYKKTIGTTFASKDVPVVCNDGMTRNARLIIWDMAGQDTYKELRRRFMKGAAGAVIVYDVTRPETFMAMNNWFEAFRDTCPAADVVICANKVDLEDQRMVPEEPGHMLRDWFQAEYFETSAKTGLLVTDVFAKLAESMMLRRIREHDEPKM